MSDPISRKAAWNKLFAESNEFDSWGQIEEAREGYLKLAGMVQTDRAAFGTGAVDRGTSVRRSRAPPSITESRQPERRALSWPRVFVYTGGAG